MFNDQILTPVEAANYLKINSQVFEKYLRQGTIPAKKVGRQWRISKLALDLWLAPELSQILPQLNAWNSIFYLSGQVKSKDTPPTDEQIISALTNLRKKTGFYDSLKKNNRRAR